VWVADETTLREFPPLRAAWAEKGKQAEVVVSGRNSRRVVLGAINVTSGQVVRLVRERSRKEEVAAFVEALGQVRPAVKKLLIWDNAPPHHPHLVRDTASAAHITLAFLPFRSPELNPCEDLWRLLKGVVAANRVYASLELLVERALAWLDAHTPDAILRCCGLTSSKFDWLPT
jgi:transposase